MKLYTTFLEFLQQFSPFFILSVVNEIYKVYLEISRNIPTARDTASEQDL